jgi:hypothetical protein
MLGGGERGAAACDQARFLRGAFRGKGDQVAQGGSLEIAVGSGRRSTGQGVSGRGAVRPA